MNRLLSFTKFFLSFACLLVILCSQSCNSSRYKGKHGSVSKEQQLKAKSDFNLKQAKVIVNENEKDRPKNERKAERKRKKLNSELESEKHNSNHATPTHHNTENKPVPSFP